MEAGTWSSKGTLRAALVRRFAYPFLLGLVLSMSGIRLIDSGVAAALAMILLLWPALFQGLPYGVSRRDWQVGVLYLLLPAAFFGLSVAGWYIPEIIRSAANGDVVGYLLGLARDGLLTSLATAFAIAFIRGSFSSLREKAQARSSLGPEYDFTGGSVYMDPPPNDVDGNR